MIPPTPIAQRGPPAEVRDLVSIVLRTVGGRNRELRRALHSMVACNYRPLEAVLVYQGISDEALGELRNIEAEHEEIGLQIVVNPTTEDRRAENLNIGWNTAKGRYVGFLDDDDTIEPRHVRNLVDLLRSTGAAWAYGQTELVTEDSEMQALARSYPFYRLAFSYRELLVQNFIPIHSLLIDRSRLDAGLANSPFNVDLQRSEDWDFLIRLAFGHQPAVLDEITCRYFVTTSGRNSNTSLIRISPAADAASAAVWASNKAIVERRKAALLAGSARLHDYEASLRYAGPGNLPRRVLRRFLLEAGRWWFSLRQASVRRRV